jgi:hypothetical protein
LGKPLSETLTIKSSVKNISEAKLQAFSKGLNLKKSAFQLKKEAEELKQSQEALEAARVLEEYEQSFGETHQQARMASGGPSWVRGSTSVKAPPGSLPQAQVNPQQSIYKPQSKITMKIGSSFVGMPRRVSSFVLTWHSHEPSDLELFHR